VSERLPVLSGQQLIDALEKVGWVVVRQRGSHVRLKHDERTIALVVPLHRELKRARSPGSCATPGLTATISGNFSDRRNAGSLVRSVCAVGIPSADGVARTQPVSVALSTIDVRRDCSGARRGGRTE
jgi:predicted RNA binding protein YcfA (HicA-like mRNA interferase family)